ncbi:hypothetical protein C8D94_101746 [Marinirhabdus gelatinilytica]|uniref:Uncharacterized protein n=1 Tax=Marinirhabdus gelatinilytica TaxID=1703343 RepID=A0A370QKK9_9FLAO|nr:hypothetical protein C8D94_101746 [Marinirhabdus gelatinilytica]
MNIINQIETHYLKPNRTVETIFIKNIDKMVYVYNYEGSHFRLFTNLIDLIGFFQFGMEPKLDFSNELDLDDFLINELV